MIFRNSKSNYYYYTSFVCLTVVGLMVYLFYVMTCL